MIETYGNRLHGDVGRSSPGVVVALVVLQAVVVADGADVGGADSLPLGDHVRLHGSSHDLGTEESDSEERNESGGTHDECQKVKRVGENKREAEKVKRS